MGRILAIDYGRKRCGIAVTDPLQIAANGLATQRTCDLEPFLLNYCSAETVDEIIVGKPTTLSGKASESMRYIEPFLARLRKLLPDIKVILWDERFTSTIAHREMLSGGMKRSAREEKSTADRIAATLILTGYLDSRAYRER